MNVSFVRFLRVFGVLHHAGDLHSVAWAHFIRSHCTDCSENGWANAVTVREVVRRKTAKKWQNSFMNRSLSLHAFGTINRIAFGKAGRTYCCFQFYFRKLLTEFDPAIQHGFLI